MILVNPGDAPFKTNLCADQQQHFRNMRADIDEARLNIYGDYFNLCEQKFVGLFPAVSVISRIEDQEFYSVMERAMVEEDPDIFYENSDLATRVTFGILKLLPYKLADRARLALMKLPQYK